MTGFFRKLFAKPAEAPVQQAGPSKQEAINDALTDQLIGFIGPQLQMLGYELTKVPAEGTFISKRSRGYIYGIAARVVGQVPEELQVKLLELVFQGAFYLVYGAENGPPLFERTFEETVARDGETLSGGYHAEDHVSASLRGEPFQSVMGFWLLNNGIGDPDEKMPIIQNPRPLPTS